VARRADGHVLRRRAEFTPALPVSLTVSDGKVQLRVEEVA
jgi:hypothetical protein